MIKTFVYIRKRFKNFFSNCTFSKDWKIPVYYIRWVMFKLTIQQVLILCEFHVLCWYRKQRFQEGRSRRNILKICYEFSWSYWKSIFKSVKISRFSPKYSAISSFLSQVCCLVTPTESFVLKIFSKYFGGIALLEIVDCNFCRVMKDRNLICCFQAVP